MRLKPHANAIGGAFRMRQALARAEGKRFAALVGSASALLSMSGAGGHGGILGSMNPGLRGFGDDASMLAAYFNRTQNEVDNYGAIIPGDSAVESLATMGLYNFLNYYNFAMIARLLLTWFPNPPQVIVGPLATLCDPYLNLFRGIIPPLGMLDLSPIISLTLLNFLTSSVQALPCEMPKKKLPSYKASTRIEKLSSEEALKVE